VAQRSLEPDDVTTRIGQKFQAAGTNIQKISILLSVEEDTTARPGQEYAWSGQIVLSLHALQAQVDCPTDPVPDNLEDFDPDPSLVAQLTLDAASLAKQGIVLDGYARKVDFVFTGAKISDPQRTPIEQDAFYAFTVGRAGDAALGTLLVEEAVHTAPNGYLVVFDGESWTNVYESDMWFLIQGDYIKVSDGISYQDGVGSEIPRLRTDDTGVETTYVEGPVSFFTSARGQENYALVETSSEFSDIVQDPRTGNPISSRVRPDPDISMITSSELESLVDGILLPLVLAKAADNNPRSNPATIDGTTELPGLVLGNKMDVIDPDADLRNNNLVGSMLQPNSAGSGKYRIIKQELFSDILGDVDGDGVVTSADLAIVNSWLPDGYNLANTLHQQSIMDGNVPIEQVLRADVNGDGMVDATDAALIQDFLDGYISVFPGGAAFSRMRLTVEHRTDPLGTPVVIEDDDPTFSTAPFSDTDFLIEFCATWLPDRLSIVDQRRLIPTTFTEPPSVDDCTGGRNDWFAPGNLHLDGYLLNPDGTSYSVDVEVAHLTLTIPVTDSNGDPVFADGYLGVSLFDAFVFESSEGKTPQGFPALRYADGSYVQSGDLAAGRVRMSAALQSHANTWSTGGSTIEDVVGMNYDPATSIMTLYMKDVLDDGYGNLPIPPALTTKILVTVFLKRAGFANQPLAVTAAQMRNLLEL